MDTQNTPAGVPTVVKSIREITEVTAGDRIDLRKIDPQTGKETGKQILLRGALHREPDFDAISIGNFVYVQTAPDKIPNHTSPVESIDLMSDGKYWIRTVSGSVYRLDIISSQGQITDDTPPSSSVLGEERSLVRNLINRLTKRDRK